MITLLSLFISVQIIYKTLSSVHGKTMYRVSIIEQKIKQSFVFYLEYIRKHFILQDLSDVTTRTKYTCPTLSHCVMCALIFMKKNMRRNKMTTANSKPIHIYVLDVYIQHEIWNRRSFDVHSVTDMYH